MRHVDSIEEKGSMKYGAVIERGKIEHAADATYTVSSYDREGIITPPIRSIDGHLYNVGDTVYFFLFPDGTGKILCGA